MRYRSASANDNLAPIALPSPVVAPGKRTLTQSLQRKAAPTIGPSADDRSDGPAPAPAHAQKHDLRGRVTGRKVEGGITRLNIGLGSEQGVEVGMPGYLTNDAGYHAASLKITAVDGGGSIADVGSSLDDVSAYKVAIINPSSGGDAKPVQRAGGGAADADYERIHALSGLGVAGAGHSLPHLDAIQRSFGPHDVSGVVAHTDGAAAHAATAIGAQAYATGNHVAFAGAPDLHTAAHEAAHVVQQRAGVHLKGGVGAAGDAYEQHADAVADRVVQGLSAASLLGDDVSGAGEHAIQMEAKEKDKHTDVVDDSKLGQGLAHILAANATLEKATKLSTPLLHTAQKEDVADDVVTERAQPVLALGETVKQELGAAFRPIYDRVSELLHVERLPEAQAKHTALGHPGLEAAVGKLTTNLAHYLSDMTGVADARKNGKALYLSSMGETIKVLNYVQANLGLPQTHWNDLLARVDIKVGVKVVDLGSGSPRDQMQEAVGEMAHGWNVMVTNYATAVEQTVGLISQDELKDDDGDLLDKLWEQAEELLKKGSEIVAGTPLAATIGIAAIKKIMAYGDKQEKEKLGADKEKFATDLRARANAVQLEGLKEGGNLQINDLVNAVDKEFSKRGRDAGEDQWKHGDKVVFGPQADFLKDLQSKAKDYLAHIPARGDFTGRFLVEWVNASNKDRGRGKKDHASMDRTHKDGYINLDLKLYYSKSTGFGFERDKVGKLHCPNSEAIAKQIVESFPMFSLNELSNRIWIDITADGDARDKLESFDDVWSHNRTNRVQLDTGHEPVENWAADYWRFLMHQMKTSTYEILSTVRKLEG